MDKKKSFSAGYRKPPRHTQFKLGQSGNPGGRPKKKANTFEELFEKELNTQITVTEAGNQLKITKLQAIVKQQTNKAITGGSKAAVLVMKILEPRPFEPMDNLSPVLAAMQAIHAKHELANPNGAPIADASAPLATRRIRMWTHD